jgi:hypothetical protein
VLCFRTCRPRIAGHWPTIVPNPEMAILTVGD